MPLNGFISLNYEPEILNNSYLQYTSAWAIKIKSMKAKKDKKLARYSIPFIYSFLAVFVSADILCY